MTTVEPQKPYLLYDNKIFSFVEDAPELFILQALSTLCDYTSCVTEEAAIQEIMRDDICDDEAIAALIEEDDSYEEGDEDEYTEGDILRKKRELAAENLHTFTREELLEHIKSGHSYEWCSDYLDIEEVEEDDWTWPPRQEVVFLSLLLSES